MEQKEELNTELESFRQQWLNDLHSRHEALGYKSRPSGPSSGPKQHRKQPSGPSQSTVKKPAPADDDEDYFEGRSFDEPPEPSGHTLAGPSKSAPKELISALDHFERAMEKEAEGNMGDSLKLYRQAYKVRAYYPANTVTPLT